MLYMPTAYLRTVMQMVVFVCIPSFWINLNVQAKRLEVTSLSLVSDHCGHDSCRHLVNLNPAPSPVIIGENDTIPLQGGTGLIYQSERYRFGTSDLTQLVFLDFSQRSASFPAIDFDGSATSFQAHTFSTTEKVLIQSRLEADFAEFNLAFSSSVPTDSDYTTIKFECHSASEACVNLAEAVILGNADEPDDGNWDRNDVAYADPNLWRAIIEIDPSGQLLSELSGIDITDGDIETALSTAIINHAANVGAHQLGHNLGLRHQDAFGPPGLGVPGNELNLADSYYPAFTGPRQANETLNHLMSSASIGTDLKRIANSDQFFSERSALKLHALDAGYYQTEREAIGEQPGEGSNIQTIHLREVDVPNTILEGVNAAKELDVRATIVSATIDGDDDIDFYRFYATADNHVSVDINSFDVPSFDRFITNLTLYYQQDDGSYHLVSENQQTFEGYDGNILDAYLAEEGNYVIAVSSAINVHQGLDETGNLEWMNLYDSWNGHLRGGDYKLFVYVFLP